MKREHMLAAVLGALIAVGLSGCGSDVGTHIVTGPAGPAGANGINGTSCSVSQVLASTVAPNGGSLISCQDGTSNLVLNGTNGSNGSNGKDAVAPSLANPVQLCTGVTTYPSKFIEVAFCINNNLYAVYSINNGFLTEIPEGQYSSDGVNASCTFTVKANCQVTH